MNRSPTQYSLDANVLIQAWQKYYSPKICPDYWEVLIKLGSTQRIFLAEEIYEEIADTEDDLTVWLKSSQIPIRKTDANVIGCWKSILAADPIHKELVHERTGRSKGDPWLISHAMDANATVVTKEELITAANSKTVKIPNVCNNMGIRWLNDFEFVQELGIRFNCSWS